MKKGVQFLQFYLMLCFASVYATAQSHALTILLDSIPANTPRGSTLFIAGNFTNWKPDSTSFCFNKDGGGNYSLKVDDLNGNLEFKIARGSWDKSEVTKTGTDIPNRTIQLQSDSIIHIKVEGWKDQFKQQEKMHTASANVITIPDFKMPQLSRTRTLRVYLPGDYQQNQRLHHPVLYLQDGQNVFDEATAFAGEWGVDEFLDSATLTKCIVVAIDNGGDLRLNEYMPYSVKRIPKAEGKQYAAFLVETLKPYIDKKFRTLKGKANTFIAGSSMGGLISFYTALKYPKVFGGVGVFSPSFWVTENKIYRDITGLGKAFNSNIYFYAGMLEGATMPADLLKAAQALAEVSKADITTVIRSNRRHNEEAWQKEFPFFYQAIISKK